jgi:predicted transglutaminase-like cysteine proteinase
MLKPDRSPRPKAVVEDRPTDKGRRSPHAALGVFSSAAFQIALCGLPLVGAATTHALSAAGAFSFTASHASLVATGRTLDEAAAALAADSRDRLAAWNDMVARELAEGDEAAARGILLAAGAIVGAEARAATQARAEGSDEAVLAAARPLLDPSLAQAAEEAGVFDPIEAAPLVAAGDSRDLAVQARSFLDGRGAALSDLVLTGVSVSAPELAALFQTDPAALQSGVITLKAALRSGRLQPQFLADVQAVLHAVDADSRLSAGLADRLNTAEALADEPGAARAAYVESLAPTPAWREVTALLAQVDALNDRTGWTGAVELLTNASSYADLERLQLMAQARGATAVSLAKRTAEPAAFIALARSDFEMTSAIQAGLTALAALVLIMLVAPIVTLVHAVLQIWGGSANSRNGGSRVSPDPRKPDRSANDRPLAA